MVAAVPGKKIRVKHYTLSAAGAVNAKWRSGTSTDLSGLIYLAAAGSSADAGGVAPPEGVFETAAGQALTLDLSAAVAVGGHLTYSLD